MSNFGEYIAKRPLWVQRVYSLVYLLILCPLASLVTVLAAVMLFLLDEFSDMYYHFKPLAKSLWETVKEEYSFAFKFVREVFNPPESKS